MKTKGKIILTAILVLIIITLSNIGQFFLSNEQFRKEDNKTNLRQ